ncbi:RNA polymerase sigma-70 factor (ECF subfamily) [Chitinophaga terrae (ex Kim and Jung 2007)]|uniref:RNA polymerase sigma factor n=1 Tax=Chitinophaga terrae (ex Kim and Jung 2007) TaxID=408074 RepID=UPI002782CAF9|nr:sigma-70 family RNA polymerase sigma factor [Chitinophaga terrae (ex Kim and Jung 2007)]MDQ0107501.1 RNA polymerase sigma-70 factor (ECF subfamily) [Chitinophaga terrae (ex Kim and Jung 2007)]
MTPFFIIDWLFQHLPEPGYFPSTKHIYCGGCMYFKDDNHIISALKEGNVEAFNELYSKYHRYMLTVALTYLGPYQEEAMDAVQDAFVRIWEKRQQIPEIQSFKAYLHTSIKNSCFNRLDRKKNYLKHISKYSENIETEVQPGDRDFYLAKKLHDHIQEITSRRKREVVHKYIWEGKSYQEIIEETGLKKQTARNIISEELAILRKKLKKML